MLRNNEISAIDLFRRPFRFTGCVVSLKICIKMACEPSAEITPLFVLYGGANKGLSGGVGSVCETRD